MPAPRITKNPFGGMHMPLGTFPGLPQKLPVLNRRSFPLDGCDKCGPDHRVATLTFHVRIPTGETPPDGTA